MQFMISIDFAPEKKQTPPPAETREAEFESVRALYTEGLIRQIWVRADGGGACMIVEAAEAAEVERKLGALPMVREGYLQAPSIVPIAPYWGFAPRG